MGDTYSLSNNIPLASYSPWPSVLDEHVQAFADSQSPFLYFWHTENGVLRNHILTREEFWQLAQRAAKVFDDMGLRKGDRVIHGFSDNSPYDLIFRLAGVLTGVVAATINWQADDLSKIEGKIKLTAAGLVVHDGGFVRHINSLRNAFPSLLFYNSTDLCHDTKSINQRDFSPEFEDEKMVIFTSGSTGFPKGVSLTHRSYRANRLTFDSYFDLADGAPLDLLLVNPLHHTNSSALSDWAMRRPKAAIHLVERYSTIYWQILTEVAEQRRGLVVTALVARHLDFLVNLVNTGALSITATRLQKALHTTEVLLGSAPVGPTTIRTMQSYAGKLPHVRFGATETCLQVLATPFGMNDQDKMEAFEAGWQHQHQGERISGYYIGREHYPVTRASVVKAVDPDQAGFMTPCDVGQPGYIITQGPNLMSGYLDDPEATHKVFHNGWYTGLRDIVFTRKGKDGKLDYYWMSRDSALLIKGGANYSLDQTAAELCRAIKDKFHLSAEQFDLAVSGLRITSEHDDSCCVTIELRGENKHLEKAIEEYLLGEAKKTLSKGSKPDYVRFAEIPRSFKGDVLHRQVQKDFAAAMAGQSAGSKAPPRK